MDYHGSERKGKRIRDDDEEEDNLTRAFTREETPSFLSVLMEALRRNEVQCVCPYLAHAQRTITRGELSNGNWKLLLLNAFNELLHRPGSSILGALVGQSLVLPPSTSSPPRMLGSDGQKLQLRIETKMPEYLFSRDSIKGEGESEIHVFLVDPSNGSVVQTGPASAADLNVVVLEGDFDEEIKHGWEHDIFKSRQVKEREGKPPLLVGTVRVTLNGGVGILQGLSFTDNSSFTRSKKFKLGVEMASGYFGGIRVIEAITNAFQVKDRRGKAYDKHDIPALHDEVWRLTNIAKDGTIHKSLDKAKIKTVEDLLRIHVKDPLSLRAIVKGMTDKKWETTINHAKKFFPLGDKFYVYYTDGTKISGVIFNHIHEPLKFITDGQVLPLQSFDETQKKFRVRKAYENWNQVIECDEQFFSTFTASKTAPSDQQIQPDYTSAPQQLLQPPLSSSDPEKSSLQNQWTEMDDLDSESLVNEIQGSGEFNIGDEIWRNMVRDSPYSDMSELHIGLLVGAEPLPVCGSVKAVVGWLKIKAVLKWGIMVRNRAAKKRAKLTALN